MPSALHPQAKFDPIPPDLDIQVLVERVPNFQWAPRVTLRKLAKLSKHDFEEVVVRHVIQNGQPLVIEKCHGMLPRELFNVDWLERAYDKKQENVRDIVNQSDIPMTTGHYLRSMRQLTNQWTSTNFRDERRQRLYLKDIDCPAEWREHLRRFVPPNLWYLNENVTANGNAPGAGPARRATAAPAGDLMSGLPEHMRAQNLMCYIGHEGTYTPAHREMCASLGQNIMVETSTDGNGEKAGSSLWFMTETKDREVVGEYFLSMLGHDIEIEKHFAQINAWKKATFPVYVVEQRLGDFVLVPPLAPHQVWNRGTRTMKVAWNRTTVETLEMALHEALPKARLVCRDEQYKNKAIIYFTLEKYHRQLLESGARDDDLGHRSARSSPRIRQLAEDFRRLFKLFSDILADEMFGPKERNVEYVEFDSNITCSYCRCNIFNRFLTCKHCVRTLVDGSKDTYDVCMECYAMGRSCACVSGLKWCEQWKWETLAENHEAWRDTVIRNDGLIDVENSPPPLDAARLLASKKSVAHICQKELRRRPFKDITKPEPAREPTPESTDVDDNDGKKKKKKKKKNNKKQKRKKKSGDIRRCHVCFHKDYAYKLNECSNPDCGEAYCYGVLYRAFDLMPQRVLEDENWLCPKCLGNCNCGACRRAGTTRPYTPKNTMLGHDTRTVADDRSVESVVDFRVHNLGWLKAAGEEGRSKNSKRMQALREQADTAKSQQSIDDSFESLEQRVNGYESQAHPTGTADGSNLHTPSMLDDAGTYTPAGPLADVPVASAYPDPNQQPLFGMGYYERDATPDRILFYPFQAPTMAAFEEVEEEYARQVMRAQNRKPIPQAENDNSDLASGRLFKRSKSQSQPDFLENMDPALFAETPADRGGAVAFPVPANGESSRVHAMSAFVPAGQMNEGSAEGAAEKQRPAAAGRSRTKRKTFERVEIVSGDDDPKQGAAEKAGHESRAASGFTPVNGASRLRFCRSASNATLAASAGSLASDDTASSGRLTGGGVLHADGSKRIRNKASSTGLNPDGDENEETLFVVARDNSGSSEVPDGLAGGPEDDPSKAALRLLDRVDVSSASARPAAKARHRKSAPAAAEAEPSVKGGPSSSRQKDPLLMSKKERPTFKDTNTKMGGRKSAPGSSTAPGNGTGSAAIQALLTVVTAPARPRGHRGSGKRKISDRTGADFDLGEHTTESRSQKKPRAAPAPSFHGTLPSSAPPPPPQPPRQAKGPTIIRLASVSESEDVGEHSTM